MKLSEFHQSYQQNQEYIEASKQLKLHFELANAVLRARLKKGWSQSELAKAIGTKQANISRIEAGLANPTLILVQKLLNVLDMEAKIIPSETRVPYAISSNGYSLNGIEIPDWPGAECNPRYETNSLRIAETKGRFK
jgi:transcriptional regulator with XRE-family HTH domain